MRARCRLILPVALLLPLAAAAQGDSSARAKARVDSVRADSALEARTSVVAAELRCAVCQGISIQESPSALAREMRDVVKEQLRAGASPEQVKAYFVSKYGEWILLSPRPRGLNLLLLYVLPTLLLFGGLVFVGVSVRRWIGRGAAATPPSEGAP